MNLYSWLQLFLYFVVLILLAKPLGSHMAKVYQSKPTFLDRALGPVERFVYRICSVHPEQDMNWKTYAIAVLLFNLFGLLAVYALQRLQAMLPFNPMALGPVRPDSSWNTATSFATNTNWQGYAGEVTMSYLTQMLGMTVQNFVSAATGMAVLVALIRGFVRAPLSILPFSSSNPNLNSDLHNAKMVGARGEGIGNFWVDLTRTTLYILVPLSIVVALLIASQGVVQTFDPYKTVSLLQPTTDVNGKPVTEQVLAVGPAASQIAIKQLGTNGGGFFGVNSAHPFENPTPFSNFVEMLSILLIPAALCYTFGVMVGDTRQGWVILAVMTIILVAFLGLAIKAEQGGNPAFAALGVDQVQSNTSPGGNMEGKETRFGIVNSALWATVTTAASNGSVNSMHDSYMPLGGMVPLFMIQLGEIIFGGVGSGLYGMLAFIIVAVFIAGLMVGRTPEYLGKKIEAFEMKMASLMLLIPIFLAKVGTAIAVVAPAGLATIGNTGGPHGFSEVLYAFSSAANNNGSAFAGLGANTPFYNTALGICMFFARYWLIVPVLAIAGSLVRKKKIPASSGTLPTHTPLFAGWLIGVIMIVGALSFLPALALGPIVEHLMIFK